MFACWHSSPTAPVTRTTCQTTQTTLDAHRHHKPQTAKKDMGLRPHSATKGKKKHVEEGLQENRTSTPEDGLSSVGEAEAEAVSSPKITVHNADEARALLEEEQIIESGMELSITDLVEALIHISVLDSMPLLARNTVCSVALLLDWLKLAGTGEAIVN